MKNKTIKTEWSLRSCFEQMRDPDGDVMLTEKEQEEIIRLVEERSRKWIKFKKKKPALGQAVLVFTEHGYQTTESLSELEDASFCWEAHNKLSSVLYWMPLPPNPF
jgi:hypothetical protein